MDLHFASPRKLPKAEKVAGRVVVLDIAFAASAGGGVSFNSITKPFIHGLGHRLAAWVDHHDHELHKDFADDERFVLATKAQFGACPPMIDKRLVDQVGPVDSIVCHSDLDGIYAAAKWMMGGVEIYPGADEDAVCVDTRLGEPGPIGTLADFALRARFRDEHLKHALVTWLVQGRPSGVHCDMIRDAADGFAPLVAESRRLANAYEVREGIAICDTAQKQGEFDKTELLLEGQKRGDVSIVRDSGMLTIAARFDSGWNFVSLLSLDGGMPTRVSVPESRLRQATDLIRKEWHRRKNLTVSRESTNTQ